MSRRQELFDMAHEIRIRVINAQKPLDANKIAIHLLNPSLDELEDALFQAEKDLFPTIVLHTVKTWPHI